MGGACTRCSCSTCTSCGAGSYGRRVQASPGAVLGKDVNRKRVQVSGTVKDDNIPTIDGGVKRIGVVGCGGVGGYFGAVLAAAGYDVRFLVRAGAHFDQLRAHGLKITSTVVPSFEIACTAETSAEAIGACDMVIVSTKAYALEAVAPTLKPLLQPGGKTAVIPLLNGIEAPRILAAALGEQYVLGGLCRIISWIEGPGHIKQLGQLCNLHFGELSGEFSQRVKACSVAFEKAGITYTVVPKEEGGVRYAMWDKFAAICACSGSGAVTRSTMGEMREEPRTFALFKELLQEGYHTARAHGVALTDESMQSTIQVVTDLAASSTFSLQRDMMAGRVSELDAQVGAMVRLADEKNVPVPAMSLVLAALLPQHRAAVVAASKL